MEKFINYQPLIDSVAIDDVENIKRVLIDLIFFLNGNEIEIESGLKYVQEKSSFAFEDHKVLDVSNGSDNEMYFSEEKYNMLINYSYDRFKLLIDLYKKAYANKTFDLEIEGNDTSNIKQSSISKVVVISVLAVASVFLLYKCLKNE